MDCVDTIGGHYNPFNVSLGISELFGSDLFNSLCLSLANTNDGMSPSQFSNYSDDCSVRYNLR